MIHTFKSQKEIIIDCNDDGITLLQKNSGNEDDDSIHFSWYRIPELIESLKAMNDHWNQSCQSS